MSAVKTDQSEGILGAGILEQAVKKMLTGSAALSLPSPHFFFALFFSIHAFPTSHNSVNCDRPGKCSPKKDCLRGH